MAVEIQGLVHVARISLVSHGGVKLLECICASIVDINRVILRAVDGNRQIEGRTQDSFQCFGYILDMTFVFSDGRRILLALSGQILQYGFRLGERKLIISSNNRLTEFEKLYGQRVFSRLAGSFECLLFYGKDIRVQKFMNGES